MLGSAAIKQRSPGSIRELTTKSKSKQANCGTLAPNGQRFMQEVQRLYIRAIALSN